LSARRSERANDQYIQKTERGAGFFVGAGLNVDQQMNAQLHPCEAAARILQPSQSAPFDPVEIIGQGR
jgi:hypothetical protein